MAKAEAEVAITRAAAESEGAVIKAKGDSQVTVILAEADSEAAIIRAKADAKGLDIVDRAKERILNKEVRRQKNIESIIDRAAEEMPEQVSDTKVDEDWTVNFFRNNVRT